MAKEHTDQLYAALDDIDSSLSAINRLQESIDDKQQWIDHYKMEMESATDLLTRYGLCNLKEIADDFRTYRIKVEAKLQRYDNLGEEE